MIKEFIQHACGIRGKSVSSNAPGQLTGTLWLYVRYCDSTIGVLDFIRRQFGLLKLFIAGGWTSLLTL